MTFGSKGLLKSKAHNCNYAEVVTKFVEVFSVAIINVAVWLFRRVALGRVRQKWTAAAGNINECCGYRNSIEVQGRESDSRVHWLLV